MSASGYLGAPGSRAGLGSAGQTVRIGLSSRRQTGRKRWPRRDAREEGPIRRSHVAPVEPQRLEGRNVRHVPPLPQARSAARMPHTLAAPRSTSISSARCDSNRSSGYPISSFCLADEYYRLTWYRQGGVVDGSQGVLTALESL